MIYTSGTTGKPKGVMIEHSGMVNHLLKDDDLSMGSDSIVALTASYLFNIRLAGVQCVTGGGAAIGYSDEMILNPVNFLGALESDKVTIWECVPSYLSSVLSEPLLPALPDLRYVLTTGEAVGKHLIAQWFARYPARR